MEKSIPEKSEIMEEFEKILEEFRDPLAIAKKKLYNKKKEIEADKDFGL